MITTIQHVARWWPTRVACLEQSAAATVALALTGKRVTWCHGVATDPVALHAWIDVDHTPVAEPPSTHRYTPITRIPPETPHP